MPQATSNAELIAKLRPLLDYLTSLELRDPQAAKASLGERFPMSDPLIQELKADFVAGVEAGWLCDREGGGAKFSRVSKATGETADISIDAVALAGAAPRHAHPNGEIDLCFVSEGEATFDGHPEGWVVYGPGSEHVPTVSDGSMNILYFLPQGAIEWR